MKNLIAVLLSCVAFANGLYPASAPVFETPYMTGAVATAPSNNMTTPSAWFSPRPTMVTFLTEQDGQAYNTTFSRGRFWKSAGSWHPRWMIDTDYNALMNLFVDGPFGTNYFALTEENLRVSNAIPWYANWTAESRDDPLFYWLGEVRYWGSVFLQDDDYRCGIIHHGCTHRPYWQDLFKMYPDDPNLARQIYFVMKIHTAINLSTDVLYTSLANSIATAGFVADDLILVATEQQSLNARFMCDMRIKFVRGVKSFTWDIVSSIALVWMKKGIMKITWDPTGGQLWDRTGGKDWWEKRGSGYWEYIRTGNSKKKPPKKSSIAPEDRTTTYWRPKWWSKLKNKTKTSPNVEPPTVTDAPPEHPEQVPPAEIHPQPAPPVGEHPQPVPPAEEHPAPIPPEEGSPETQPPAEEPPMPIPPAPERPAPEPPAPESPAGGAEEGEPSSPIPPAPERPAPEPPVEEPSSPIPPAPERPAPEPPVEESEEGEPSSPIPPAPERPAPDPPVGESEEGAPHVPISPAPERPAPDLPVGESEVGAPPVPISPASEPPASPIKGQPGNIRRMAGRQEREILPRDTQGDYYDDGDDSESFINRPPPDTPSRPFFQRMASDGLFIWNSYYDPSDYFVTEPFVCGRGVLQPADNFKTGATVKHWLSDQSISYKVNLSTAAAQLNMGTFYDDSGASVLSHIMASNAWIEDSEFLRLLENPAQVESVITKHMKEALLGHTWVSAGCFLLCSADSSAIGGPGDGLSRFQPEPGRTCQAQCVSRDHKRTIVPLPGLQQLARPPWNFDMKQLLKGAYENFKEYGNSPSNSWFEMMSHFDSGRKPSAFVLPVCDSDGYAQIPDLTDPNMSRGGTDTFPASCGNGRADGLRDFLASTSLITPVSNMPRDGPMPFNDPTDDYLWQHVFPYSVDKAISWPLDQYMSYCEAGIHWPKICPRDRDAKLFMSSMHAGPSKWCAEIKERYKNRGDFAANIDYCVAPEKPLLYEYKTLDVDLLYLKNSLHKCRAFLENQARRDSMYGRYLRQFRTWQSSVRYILRRKKGQCPPGESSDPD